MNLERYTWNSEGAIPSYIECHGFKNSLFLSIVSNGVPQILADAYWKYLKGWIHKPKPFEVEGHT